MACYQKNKSPKLQQYKNNKIRYKHQKQAILALPKLQPVKLKTFMLNYSYKACESNIKENS